MAEEKPLIKFRVEFLLPPFGLSKEGARGAIQIEAENELGASRIASWILHPAASVHSVKPL